jgi:hypothetical protein
LGAGGKVEGLMRIGEGEREREKGMGKLKKEKEKKDRIEKGVKGMQNRGISNK